MFSADSSTLKSESDVQSRARAPTIPRVVALSCTARTRSTMRPISVPGSACCSSRTRKLDSSARWVRPSAERVARAARELLEAAREVRPEGALTQAEASTAGGSLFVVREGERLVAATTGPEPTVGLVFYDLKATLRSVEDVTEPTPARRARRKKDDDGEA